MSSPLGLRRLVSSFLLPGIAALILAPLGRADIYLSQSSDSTVSDYTPTGTLVASRTTGGDLYTLALDPSGNLFVTDLNGGVLKFPAGQPLNTSTYGSLSTSGTVAFYFGTASDSSGNIFFTTDANTSNSSDIKSFKYTAGAGAPASFSDTNANTTFSVRNTIAADPITGNIFIADNYNSDILEYSSSGGTSPIKTFTTGVTSPIDIAVDSLGDLYVADGNGNIEKINISSSSASPAVTDLTSLQGLAVDGQNNLYYIALDANNKGGVFEISSTGTSLGELFNTGSSEANFITVTVPEPTSPWTALLAVGAATLLLAPRNRRKPPQRG